MRLTWKFIPLRANSGEKSSQTRIAILSAAAPRNPAAMRLIRFNALGVCNSALKRGGVGEKTGECHQLACSKSPSARRSIILIEVLARRKLKAYLGTIQTERTFP
jgi:hypothetical protein